MPKKEAPNVLIGGKMKGRKGKPAPSEEERLLTNTVRKEGRGVRSPRSLKKEDSATETGGWLRRG